MTSLDEMWAELEKYQFYADRKGFGAEWRRMCEERTARAAAVVLDSARAGWAANAVRAASWAEFFLANDSESAEMGRSAWWSKTATNDIRRAIKQEEQT